MNPEAAYAEARDALAETLILFEAKVDLWDGQGLSMRTTEEIAQAFRAAARTMAALLGEADQEVREKGDYSSMYHAMMLARASMCLLETTLQFVQRPLPSHFPKEQV